VTPVAQLNFPLDQIAEICRRYQVVEMLIFGSAVRGRLRPDSDLDVLVEFAPGVSWGWDYFGLEQELSEVVGRRVNLATKKWLKPSVRANILRNAHVVYGVTP
jgi:predicted nucleotidyltransferase